MRLSIKRSLLTGLSILAAGCFHDDNAPPRIDVELQVSAVELSNVVIDASDTRDPDGDSLTFRWEQTGGPAPRSIGATDEATLSFVAPKVTNAALLEFRLTVEDRRGARATEDVGIAIREGRTIVYVANQDRADAFEVYRVHETDTAPVKLHADVVPSAGITRINLPLISPDRQYVAYVADRDGNGNQNLSLYVARLDGGGEVQFAFGTAPVDSDIAWAPDSGHLAFRVGSRVDGTLELYTARPDGEGGAVLVSGTAVAGGGVVGFGGSTRPTWSPDGTRLAFLGDLEVDGVQALFVVAGDGSAPRTKVASLVDNYAWAPDGARLVMQGEMETPGAMEIFTVPIDADGVVGTAVKISGDRNAAGGSTERFGWHISPAGDRIAFTGVMETFGVNELFTVALDGTGGRTKVIPGALPAGSTVTGISAGLAWSADGTRLVFSGVLDADGKPRVYSVLAGGLEAPILLSGAIPAGGDVFQTIRLQPDTGTGVQRVAFNGDLDTDEVLDLYTAPIDGSVGRVNMSRASGNFDVAGGGLWSPDGQTFAMLGDLEVDGVAEIFAIASDGTGERVNLTGPAVAGGRTTQGGFTSDSSALVFAGDVETDGTIELFLRDRTGASPRAKLSGPMIAGGGVQVFQVAGPSTN